MTETKRPLKVFLCHASADKPAVTELYKRLVKDGVDAWLDKEKLLPGQDWELEIRKAVRASDVVVVCLSRHFNQAGYRQKEVRIALNEADMKPEGEIFIIPARLEILEESEIPESLKKWNWVDLFEEGGYEKLTQALQVQGRRNSASIDVKPKRVRKKPEPLKTEETVTQVNLAQEPKEKETQSKNKKTPRKWDTAIIVAFIGLAGTIIGALLNSPLINRLFPEKDTATPTSTISVTSTQPVPSSQTPEPGRTLTLTPLPPEIIATDPSGNPVLMRLVPASEFIMGSDADGALTECKKFSEDCVREQFLDEEPPHKILIDTFYMDKYEVTNKQYEACVDIGTCPPPTDFSSYAVISYYGSQTFENYPVVYITWAMAKNYCEWRQARLPTEAEWEKAVRGDGNDSTASGLALDSVNFCDSRCPLQWANQNYDDGHADSAPVNSYPSAIGPYKIYGLSGNVWEWIGDWYSADYYQVSPESNPTGPDSGTYRVIRGGSYGDILDYTRTARRSKYDPNKSAPTLGFRCVQSVNP